MCGRYERKRKIPWPLKMLGALIVIPGLLFLGTWVTMLLWNALIPAIFGIGVITFWQSMGLLVLAKILFGGHHGKPGGFPRRPRFKDRDAWKEHMREKFADNRFGEPRSHGRRDGYGPQGGSPGGGGSEKREEYEADAGGRDDNGRD